MYAVLKRKHPRQGGEGAGVFMCRTLMGGSGSKVKVTASGRRKMLALVLGFSGRRRETEEGVGVEPEFSR